MTTASPAPAVVGPVPTASEADSGPVPSVHAYRPHLDGARALAVVAVILYHLGLPWMPGGFVGVDLFFVLSGYLITGLLLTEVTTTGGVALGRFYARRARRLLPASLLVIAAVAVTANHVLDQLDQQSVARDISWSALYTANWRFVSGGVDYFTPGDVPSPLQHFWSLAVEEQFYLVWPVLLLGVWLLGRRGDRDRDASGPLLAVISVLGAGSLWLSFTQAGTNLGYFGTPARAYQLLAGAALAVALHRWGGRLPKGPGARRAGTGLAVAGLGILTWCAVSLAGDAVYPGPVGLLVTGASLVLLVGIDVAPPGLAARALGAGVPALVGRLSYSLYLWHWPVIVFAPLLAEHHARPVLEERWAIGVVTVALATASHWLVERPVRFGLLPKAPAFAVVAVGISLSVVAAMATQPSLQPDQPFAERALAAAEDHAPAGHCPYTEGQWGDPADDQPCLYRRGGPVTLALVGDSHAQHWQPAVEALAERYDLTVVRATRSGCPVNDITVEAFDGQGLPLVDHDCTAWRERVYPRLIEEYDPDVVFAETRSLDRTIVQDDGTTLEPGDDGYLEAWTDGWRPSVEALTAGTGQVFLSEQLPEIDVRVPACLAEHGPGDGACDMPLSGDPGREPSNEVIERLDGVDGLTVVDPTPIVCPDGTCPALIDNRIVHRDDDHLTAAFARHASRQFEEMLLTAGARFEATP